MKVKVKLRKVYHKFAEVEVLLPSDIKADDICDFINNNEHLYEEKINLRIEESNLKEGLGAYDYNSKDSTEEVEWRYECDDLNIAGHL